MTVHLLITSSFKSNPAVALLTTIGTTTAHRLGLCRWKILDAAHVSDDNAGIGLQTVLQKRQCAGRGWMKCGPTVVRSHAVAGTYANMRATDSTTSSANSMNGCVSWALAEASCVVTNDICGNQRQIVIIVVNIVRVTYR